MPPIRYLVRVRPQGQPVDKFTRTYPVIVQDGEDETAKVSAAVAQIKADYGQDSDIEILPQ